MTDLRQAAQQALDWLYENDIVHPSKVSQDLRTALAQPEQEPVAWRDPTNIDPGQGCTYTKERHEKWPHIYRQALYTAPPPPLPVQEPVKGAYINKSGGVTLCQPNQEEAGFGFAGYLYTTTSPAVQRPWQGLTDDDRFEIAAEQHGWEDLLIAAEAKLKELNNG